MLNHKDENKIVVSNYHSVQSFNLEEPQLMLKLKYEITGVVSSDPSIHNFNLKKH